MGIISDVKKMAIWMLKTKNLLNGDFENKPQWESGWVSDSFWKAGSQGDMLHGPRVVA